MNVLVVGANGQIGKHIVSKLHKNKEHHVKAMVRKKEQADELVASGMDAVVADLEGTVDEIAEAAKGCDAIIFTAGSGGKTGADKTLLIDLDGAVKTVEAAKKVGADRFIIVSAHQAHNRENWFPALKAYYVAKHYADKEVARSGLNYTIIRPGGLINEPATEKISVGENLERGSIPREDVATTVVLTLTQEATYRKSFDLISGDTDIPSALKQL